LEILILLANGLLYSDFLFVSEIGFKIYVDKPTAKEEGKISKEISS